MSQTRRVSVATGASLLLHGIFFAVLALTFGGEVLESEEKREETAEAREEEPREKTEDEPLEVVFIAAPEPPPSLAIPAPEAVTVRTQLDPEFLQKVEKAPEGTDRLATHHSEGREDEATNQKKEALSPEPTEAANSEGMAMARASEPEPQTSVKAVGDWRQAVGSAVGTRWNYYREHYRKQLPVGAVCLRFKVNAAGKVSDIRVIQEKTDSGAAAAVPYVIKAVQEAQIPPMPPERLALAKGGLVEVEYTATIFESSPSP